MKFSIVTFGCRVNQADSLQIEDALRARGAENVAAHEADTLIVNTCSVTASADQGARQTIRRVARSNPNVRIFATGCYATRRPDDLSSLPNVVRVIDNQSKLVLVDLLDKEIEQSTSDRYGNGEGACGATLQPGVGGRTALTLRVQTGCNEVCSYCIIPQGTKLSALSCFRPGKKGRRCWIQRDSSHWSTSRFVWSRSPGWNDALDPPSGFSRLARERFVSNKFTGANGLYQ